MSKDIRDLTPNSSLLTFQVIAVYKDNTLLHSGEYEFSNAGLFLAFRHVIEEA